MILSRATKLTFIGYEIGVIQFYSIWLDILSFERVRSSIWF